MARVTDMSGRPVSGQVPIGVVGIVVDNVDPEGLGRIKVKYPTLPGEPESFWLRQVTPNGGAVGGVYALPEKDDEVFVIFMQGSQDTGVVMGQFWNGTTKPPTEAADGMPGSGKTEVPGGKLSEAKFNDGSGNIDANDRRFWRSRAGHLLVMDDTEGKETIQIWDGSHTLAMVFDSADSAIFLTNTVGDVHIRTKNDLWIEAGNDIKLRAGNNIEGESVQKTFHKAGTNIETESGQETKMKAGTDFKIEAGANIKMSATVNIDVEGVMFSANASSIAKVSGSASVNVRGGIVAINS